MIKSKTLSGLMLVSSTLFCLTSAHAEQSKILIYGDPARQLYDTMSEELVKTSGGGMPGSTVIYQKQGKDILCGFTFKPAVARVYECLISIDSNGAVQSQTSPK